MLALVFILFKVEIQNWVSGWKKHRKKDADEVFNRWEVDEATRDYLKKITPVGWLTKLRPTAKLDTVEKLMAYSPPFVYSKVTGIKSPTGVEAEGWLIAIGTTPQQMLAHSPDFINSRLLKATRIAKSLGAQIIGLGALYMDQPHSSPASRFLTTTCVSP